MHYGFLYKCVNVVICYTILPIIITKTNIISQNTDLVWMISYWIWLLLIAIHFLSNVILGIMSGNENDSYRAKAYFISAVLVPITAVGIGLATLSLTAF